MKQQEFLRHLQNAVEYQEKRINRTAYFHFTSLGLLKIKFQKKLKFSFAIKILLCVARRV
jgi:hypothetical protein